MSFTSDLLDKRPQLLALLQEAAETAGIVFFAYCKEDVPVDFAEQKFVLPLEPPKYGANGNIYLHAWDPMACYIKKNETNPMIAQTMKTDRYYRIDRIMGWQDEIFDIPSTHPFYNDLITEYADVARRLSRHA